MISKELGHLVDVQGACSSSLITEPGFVEKQSCSYNPFFS